MPTEERVWTTDKNYSEVYMDGKYKAVVKIMDGFDYYEDFDPRLDGNIWKFCVRKHRDYTFPNELDYDFDGEEEDSRIDKYRTFPLDCYIHSWVAFSLHWEGMQCRFDTSHNCWFIAVPKKYNRYDLEEISKTPRKEWTDHYDPKELSRTEAKEIAREELERYNQYLRWEIYEYAVYEKVKWTSEYGDERYEWEFADGVTWYWDEEAAKQDAIDCLEHCKKISFNS